MVKVAKEALIAKADGKEYIVKQEKTTKPVTKEEKNKKEVKEDKPDLTKLTVAELKELASKKDIKIPAGAKKADIINLLK
ncbi:MAG: HeH/LEM domain-containing protein [bacterium]|nr:HeH/LEM domain-containing protein [bacterium]